MEKKNTKPKAVDFFHAGSNNWNCAQAIFKSFPSKVQLTDEEIELSYRSKGGGRAEGGLCGAVYAAVEILGKDTQKAEELKRRFKEQLGGLTCRELKAELKVPCPQCVDVADELAQEFLEAE